MADVRELAQALQNEALVYIMPSAEPPLPRPGQDL